MLNSYQKWQFIVSNVTIVILYTENHIDFVFYNILCDHIYVFQKSVYWIMPQNGSIWSCIFFTVQNISIFGLVLHLQLINLPLHCLAIIHGSGGGGVLWWCSGCKDSVDWFILVKYISIFGCIFNFSYFDVWDILTLWLKITFGWWVDTSRENFYRF